MRAFVDKLHQGGRRWVPIHDSAVAKVPGYSVYDEGTKAGVWIKEASGEPYTGQVGRGGRAVGVHLAWWSACAWPGGGDSGAIPLPH